MKSTVLWRNAVTRVKEEISVNIDCIDPWNLKFLSESTETCGGMEAVHYSCDTDFQPIIEADLARHFCDMCTKDLFAHF